jgi:hypothetical protein
MTTQIDLPTVAAATPRASRLHRAWWLAWRHHRLAIVAVTTLSLVQAALLLWLHHRFTQAPVCSAFQSSCQWHLGHTLWHFELERAARIELMLACVGPILIAVFVGAPLVAREVEAGTMALIQAQELSVGRWMARKVSLLMTVTLACAAIVGAASTLVASDLTRLRPQEHDVWLDVVVFETSHFQGLAFAAFEFAVGLLTGVIVTRVVPAIAVTAALLASVRIGLFFGRPYYRPPVQLWGNEIVPVAPPQNSYVIRWNDTVSKGRPVADILRICRNSNDSAHCTYRAGLREYTLFQPASRTTVFHLFEASWMVLAAALFVFASMSLIRRNHGVRRSG